MKSSLLRRWLITYAWVSAVVIACCTLGAWVYATSAARHLFRERVDSVVNVLGRPAFPLTPQVLSTIAKLTQTDLILLDRTGRLVATTTELAPREGIPDVSRFQLPDFQCEWSNVTISNWRIPSANNIEPDDTLQLAILVPQTQLSRSRFSAAMIPIVTGAFLVVAFAAVAIYQFSRIVSRIRLIENQVGRIGERDYSMRIDVGPNDELGRLSAGIKRMAEQLQTSENTLRETERDRLVLQLSRGLAHDFRNSLAGVRLAIQTYQRENPNTDGEPLTIASNQLRTAESLLSRLVYDRIPSTDSSTPCLSIDAVVHDSLLLLQPMVEHWGIKLSVKVWPGLECVQSQTTEALSSVIFNLVLNAIQAAGENGQLWIQCSAAAQSVCFTVQDSGPGPALHIAERIYEPMISTKPEGLGMGLFVAKQAASSMGGEIVWKRENERTLFSFNFPLGKT